MGVSEDSDPTENREREFWLHANPQARELLLRGIAQAAAGRFVEVPPDLTLDAAIVDQLSD